MSEFLADMIIKKIDEARYFYYHLVLVVGPSGSGKTEVLKRVSALTDVPIINVNLELSKKMLNMSERKRLVELPLLLSAIASVGQSDLVLFDNTEILFHPDLKHDPLRLLQNLSKSKTIVASWNGSIVEGYLCYATSDHPEYRRYKIQDFLALSVEERPWP